MHFHHNFEKEKKKIEKEKNQKMFSITTKNIDPKFVFCFINVNKISFSDLALKKSKNWNVITNTKIFDEIKSSYQTFLSSCMTLDQFFQCQVVPVRKTRGDRLLVEIDEIYQFPVFTITDRNKRIQHGAEISQLNSETPVKMPVELIFAIHDRQYPEHFSPQNVPGDVEIYTVINGQAVQTPDCSGRSKCEKVILIGSDGENYYWLPNRSLIQKTFKCNKYPGKCLYKTNQSCNFKRHLKNCTDETTITSKQV